MKLIGYTKIIYSIITANYISYLASYYIRIEVQMKYLKNKFISYTTSNC